MESPVGATETPAVSKSVCRPHGALFPWIAPRPRASPGATIKRPYGAESRLMPTSRNTQHRPRTSEDTAHVPNPPVTGACRHSHCRGTHIAVCYSHLEKLGQ